MAGIGLDLKKLSESGSLLGVFRANLYAAVMSGGSWLLSVAMLIFIYFFIHDRTKSYQLSIQFLVIVTYLTSSSLIFSSVIQQVVIRYIADMLFAGKPQRILGFVFPTLGLLLLTGFGFAMLMQAMLLKSTSALENLIMVTIFTILCAQWYFSNALAGLKEYRFIVFMYFAGYGTLFLSLFVLPKLDLILLLLSYALSQLILSAGLWIQLVRSYPGFRLFNTDFLPYIAQKKALVFAGLFWQLGFWADKYQFWCSKTTSMVVIGDLLASPIYDLPMFIAFVLMTPGLAVLFYEVEANFSRFYHRYYDALLGGATLDEISINHREQVAMASDGFLNVIQVQGFITLGVLCLAPQILMFLDLSPMYAFLLRIDALSAFLLVLFMSIVNYLYYLNKTYYVLYLSLLFMLLNALVSRYTIYLGVVYYGYGLLLASFITLMIACVLLNRAFGRQTYETFMFN